MRALIRLGPALLCLFALSWSPLALAPAQEPAAAAPVLLGDCLLLKGLGYGARSPVRRDPIELAMIRGELARPVAGAIFKAPDGRESVWTKAPATDGGIRHELLEGGYAFWSFDSPTASVMLLHAQGHTAVYVNGELRNGDFYGFGNWQIPVPIQKGPNEFYFLCSRGYLSATLVPVSSAAVAAGAMMDPSSQLAPELVAGLAGQRGLGSMPVINLSDREKTIRLRVGGGTPTDTRVAAMSTRRCNYVVECAAAPALGNHAAVLQLEVLPDAKAAPIKAGTQDLSLKVAAPSERRRVTFRSRIDGSVQYYSLVPAQPSPGQTEKPGILLGLHGASVQASGHAAAYSPKSWCHIVCPTNRSPYGFDWEDWGRLDALEVLAHAQSTLDHDPLKIYLSGHSMGGHGTWTIGAHFPDRFAALGPCAGWESFWSYGGGAEFVKDDPMSEFLGRIANPSRTLMLKQNYSNQAVFILHGDADKTVSVEQARRMRDELKGVVTRLEFFEEPGGGHWYDSGGDAGADCMDFEPMWRLFTKSRLPASHEATHIDFTTVNPGNSAACHWARVEMQEKQLAASRIVLTAEPNRRRIVGTTVNVTRLSLQPQRILQAGDKLTLVIDNTELADVAMPAEGRLWLTRVDGRWHVATDPGETVKHPGRYGLLKNSMTRNVVYVYGTSGAESEWGRQKARFDAEQWAYRAHGAFEVIADRDFSPAAYPGADVVLLGHAESNSAFQWLAKAPVVLKRGSVTIGGRELKGDDLAVLFCYPRADGPGNFVVIGGTGLHGCRLTDRLPYFTSGAAFPDLMVYGPESLHSGQSGIRVCGQFGADWSVTQGEFYWRESASAGSGPDADD